MKVGAEQIPMAHIWDTILGFHWATKAQSVSCKPLMFLGSKPDQMIGWAPGFSVLPCGPISPKLTLESWVAEVSSRAGLRVFLVLLDLGVQ
jgi:hypothetical protein